MESRQPKKSGAVFSFFQYFLTLGQKDINSSRVIILNIYFGSSHLERSAVILERNLGLNGSFSIEGVSFRALSFNFQKFFSDIHIISPSRYLIISNELERLNIKLIHICFIIYLIYDLAYKLIEAFFGGINYLFHHIHSFGGIPSYRRFAGEHYIIGTV